MDRSRAAPSRSLVLPWRRLRRARTVPRLPRRAPGGRPRRQAHQGSPRASPRARSDDARRRVRCRHVSLLRRRRAGDFRFLRFLLLLARRRSRAGGLEQLERASREGLLVRGEAQYQIQVLYLWYEHKSKEALAHPSRPAGAVSAQPVVPPDRGGRSSISTSTITPPACGHRNNCWRSRNHARCSDPTSPKSSHAATSPANRSHCSSATARSPSSMR